MVQRVIFRFPLVVAILGFISSNGQVLIGPTVGGGVSWVSFHDPVSRQFYKQTPVPTFTLGMALSFQVRKNFYMHSSLLYSRKGENLSSNTSPDLAQKEVYHYIDAPIIFTHEFKIKFGRNKIIKWYAGLGPNISYWLNGRGTVITSGMKEDLLPTLHYKIAFQQTPDNPDPSKVYVADANRMQLGLNLATGWVFEPAGLQKIYITVRYEIGHTYLSKSGVENLTGINDYHGDMQARPMGLRITAAYVIDLKTADRKKGKSTSTITKKRKR